MLLELVHAELEMTHLLQAFPLIFLKDELAARTQTQLILPTISAVNGLYIVTFILSYLPEESTTSINL